MAITRWSFRNKKTGRFKACRLSQVDALMEDPMSAGAPIGEFIEEWRRRDVRDGCPSCTADVLENASEPDVMQRWGFR